jgi:hypothetical protein
MKKIIAATVALAAIVFSESAIAQSVFIKALDRVLVFEGTPNAPFEAFIWTGKTKLITANLCGLAIVPTYEHPMQRVIASGSNVNYSDLPIQTLVTCSGGVLSEPRPSNFKTADGRTVLVGRSGSIEVFYMARSKRGGTFNACGFKLATIKNADAIGADSIPIDYSGNTQSLGDLISVDSLPICKKVGSVYTKYIKKP